MAELRAQMMPSQPGSAAPILPTPRPSLQLCVTLDPGSGFQELFLVSGLDPSQEGLGG